ncbi:hypothetical protein [Kineococcus indalonis]|uniref:hypothetical protein n=1 Tax=Kineococcus indalonis TaxID=2696566 RepID=UPI001412C05E|nr:hypothetical protein [Kineococcus indalonis]NAZ87862.1 hypothetical protein [Kineococcus indalonis]
MQLGATAAESVTIQGNDVILRAEGRTEVYDLSYVRMLVPYLTGERDVPPMRLAHFRPGIKPWICLSVIDDDGCEPDLSGVVIYSGMGTHREMGLHLNRSEAWRLAEMLQHTRSGRDELLHGEGVHGDGVPGEHEQDEQDRAA